MKKLFFISLILGFTFLPILPCCAKERVVANISSTEIISEGLYFKICEAQCLNNSVKLTVQAKNKSLLSQAIFIEIIDDNGNHYRALNKDSINIFGPLKFNKTVTQKLVFELPSSSKNYMLAVYNQDIFKKNKKNLITKMPLKDVTTK